MSENARTIDLTKEVEQIRKDLLNGKYNTFIKSVKSEVENNPFSKTFDVPVENEIYAKYFLLRLCEEGVMASLNTIIGMCGNSYSITIDLPMTFDIELDNEGEKME